MFSSANSFGTPAVGALATACSPVRLGADVRFWNRLGLLLDTYIHPQQSEEVTCDPIHVQLGFGPGSITTFRNRFALQLSSAMWPRQVSDRREDRNGARQFRQRLQSFTVRAN